MSTIYLTKTASRCHWYALLSSDVSTVTGGSVEKSIMPPVSLVLMHHVAVVNVLVNTHRWFLTSVSLYLHTYCVITGGVNTATVSSLSKALICPLCHHRHQCWHWHCVIDIIDAFNVSPMLSHIRWHTFVSSMSQLKHLWHHCYMAHQCHTCLCVFVSVTHHASVSPASNILSVSTYSVCKFSLASIIRRFACWKASVTNDNRTHTPNNSLVTHDNTT